MQGGLHKKMKISGVLNDKKTYAVFDELALGDPSSEAVEYAGDLPAAWRLLRVGDNALTQDGRPLTLSITAEDIAGIVEYSRTKGAKIPIDSRHALYAMSKRYGVPEADVLRLIPQGVAALGFGMLEARADGLWIAGVEWGEIARHLLHSGFFRYFSPVLRGLVSGPLRVTSVALDNVPGLNNLDVIAASAESDAPGGAPPENQTQRSKKMSKLSIALAKLLGKGDELVLAAENEDAVAAEVLALAAELPELRAGAARAAELALGAERAKRDALFDDAEAKGKIGKAQREALAKIGDTAVLGDILAGLPEKAIKLDTLPAGAENGEPALTPADKEFAARLGVAEADYLKSKKQIKEGN